MATVGDDALYLPRSVMVEARQCAERDATPLDQFVAEAVMEKIAALKTHQYFAASRKRADMRAFDRFLAKTGCNAPRPDDAVPSDW